MGTRDQSGTRREDGQSVRRFCTHCGAEATNMTFCGACGSPIAREEHTEEFGPFQRTEAAGQRAAARVESGRLDSAEEAAAAAHADDETSVLRGAPAPPHAGGTPAPGSGRSDRRPLMIALIAVAGLAIAGGAVAAVLLTSNGGNASASYRAKLTAAFAPVITANRSLSSTLGSLHGNDVNAAQRAASQAQNASSSARGALNALSAPSASQLLASQARQAIDREDSYLSAVSAALANPSSPVVSQLQGLAGNVTTVFDAVGEPLNGASQSVSGADTLMAWAQRTAHQQQQQQQQNNNNNPGQSSGPGGSSSSGTQPPSANPFVNGRDCGGGLYAGPNTSCEFAQNVRDAYDAAPGVTTTLNVYSPVTGQTYVMFCSPAGAGVTCSGGNNASVAW